MEKPIIALMYDFDHTLCDKDMQEYAFFPSIGHTPEEFWGECRATQQKHHMDGILVMMYYMIKKARGRSLLTRETLVEQGQKITFYPGVLDWFQRINAYGEERGCQVEHYIISSGLKAIIDGTAIANEFKAVFASEFCYDEDGVPFWPAIVINYTSKLQYLYRINKGILDVTEDEELNDYTPASERRVPFKNMVYIGDGLTDVPSMKHTRLNGGHSIGVYQSGDTGKAENIYAAGRIDYMVEADYSAGSQLEKTIQGIIDKVLAK